MQVLAYFVKKYSLKINNLHGWLAIAMAAFSQPAAASNTDSLLLKTAAALQNIQTLQYTLSREMYYPADDYHRTVSWNCFLDFTRSSNAAGCAYLVEDAGWKYVFNGTELFELDKKNKTAGISRLPQKKELEAGSFFYNSVLTLKNVLPLLAADASAVKTKKDTVINNENFWAVQVNVGKRRIQNLGLGLDVMQTPYDFFYTLILHPQTGMPYEVIQRFENSFIKTTFTSFAVNAPMPDESLWYYSTYKEYKETTAKKIQPLLPAGSLAPGWDLPLLNGTGSKLLQQYKGKPLLVEFWIKNCGVCIQSAPALNRLQQKYGGSKINIVAINAYDNLEDVTAFCNKQKVSYTVLLNGRQTAASYGVNGYPAFFLLDAAGKIIYAAEGFGTAVEKELEEMISKQ
jgi:thiol-disulfide isomerase/thioredoxin